MEEDTTSTRKAHDSMVAMQLRDASIKTQKLEKELREIKQSVSEQTDVFSKLNELSMSSSKKKYIKYVNKYTNLLK